MASLPTVGLHKVYSAQITEVNRWSAVRCPCEQKFNCTLVKIAESNTYFLERQILDHIHTRSSFPGYIKSHPGCSGFFKHI